MDIVTSGYILKLLKGLVFVYLSQYNQINAFVYDAE